MEILLIIGGVIFVFFVIQVLLSSNKASRYKNILNQVADTFEAEGYKYSDIYKKRIDHLEEVGVASLTLELINDARNLAVQNLGMKPYDFSNNESIVLTEEKYVMKYFFAHGKAEEFKDMLEMGGKLQKIMEKSKHRELN